MTNARSAEYACAIIVRGDRIFMGKRAHYRAAYPNRWDVIGGKVEAGEDRETALVRELGEEIGIAPTVFSYLGQVVDHRIPADVPPVYHMHGVTSWSGGEPGICNHEHSEVRWFTLDELRALDGLALQEYLPVFETVLVGRP